MPNTTKTPADAKLADYKGCGVVMVVVITMPEKVLRLAVRLRELTIPSFDIYLDRHSLVFDLEREEEVETLYAAREWIPLISGPL